jgi:hypothetical protein
MDIFVKDTPMCERAQQKEEATWKSLVENSVFGKVVAMLVARVDFVVKLKSFQRNVLQNSFS